MPLFRQLSPTSREVPGGRQRRDTWFPSVLNAITIVRPETVVRWHRADFRRYWRWKSRNLGGRPPIPAELRALIRRGLGGTMSSSSGYGAASNTRRCISRPTTASARPAVRSAATWTSTTAADRIRALTAPHPIKPTSTNCHSAWQPNLGRHSTYRSGKSCSDNRDHLNRHQQFIAWGNWRIPCSHFPSAQAILGSHY